MTTITTEKQQKLNQIIQLINSIYTTKVGKYSNSYKEYYKIYELRDMDILKDLQSFRLDKLDLIIDSLISTQRCISKLKISGVSLELIFILYKTGSKRIIANINDIHTLNNSTSPFILSCDSINNGCVTFQNLKQFQPSVLQFLDTRNCCLDLTKLNLAVSSRKDIFNMIDLINSQQSINLNNTTLVKTKTHNNRYDLVLYNKQTLDNISSRLKYFCNNSSEELQQFDMNALIKFFKIILLSKLTYEINTNGAIDLYSNNSQDPIVTLIIEIENLSSWCEQMRFNVVCYNETHWMGIGLKREQDFKQVLLKSLPEICLVQITKETVQIGSYENMPLYKIKYTDTFKNKVSTVIENIREMQRLFKLNHKKGTSSSMVTW